MPYIDYKVTEWKRIHYLDTTDIKELKQLLINGHSPNGLIDEELGFAEHEDLFETSDYITPEENQGFPTIELYTNKGELFWSNKLKNQYKVFTDNIIKSNADERYNKALELRFNYIVVDNEEEDLSLQKLIKIAAYGTDK